MSLTKFFWSYFSKSFKSLQAKNKLEKGRRETISFNQASPLLFTFRSNLDSVHTTRSLQEWLQLTRYIFCSFNLIYTRIIYTPMQSFFCCVVRCESLFFFISQFNLQYSAEKSEGWMNIRNEGKSKYLYKERAANQKNYQSS